MKADLYNKLQMSRLQRFLKIYAKFIRFLSSDCQNRTSNKIHCA